MPFRDDIVIKICGSAGDGSISAVDILNRAAALMGYHILNFDSYPAEIRGFGKSVGTTRISRVRPLTPGDRADCLVSLNDPHTITELPTLNESGIVIYENRPGSFLEEDQVIAGFIMPGMTGYGAPLRDLSVTAVQSARSRNIISLGILAGIFRMHPDGFEEAIRIRFSGKKDSVVKSNIKAFHLGRKYALDEIAKRDQIDFGEQLLERPGEISIMSGNEAVAEACIDSRIRLYAGYPITPATRIMEILAKTLPDRDGLTVQTEDEISAIGHVLGAGFAGKRAVTATSGPGLCLMTELINWAVMAEIPAVVIDCQRGGPSTGLPTRTEQSDLNIAVSGGSGDSPRVVLAPTNVEECYTLTRESFEIAESFQAPVIVLLDFFLANRIEDIDSKRLTGEYHGEFPGDLVHSGNEPFKRFKLTESGISPRALPGMAGLLHTVTGLEHDQKGMPDYETKNHRDMTAKRFRKMETLARIWRGSDPFGDDGDLDAGIVSWGSTVGSVMEAIDILRGQGVRAGGLFPRLIWPVQAEQLAAFSRRSRQLFVAEMNYSGQLASLYAINLSRKFGRICGVYAGPVPVQDIVDEILRGLP
ncbi:2-oxoacid:acceptor oxidoreductase subunit alpha [bacterium]|nr:2-oxoacid:acceptor oxidoreductase subunit alpha [candidate division CSSED10-310 bacterium]